MSNNLNLDQVAENQANKEVTINTATGQIDAAMTEKLSVDIASANVGLTNTQYRRNQVIDVINASVAGRTVTLPALKRLMVVRSDPANTESFDLVVGSTTHTISAGSVVVIYTDGTTNGLTVLLETGSGAVRPYDVGTFCVGVPNNGELLLRFNYVRAVTLPAALAGSRVTAGVAATAQTDFDVRVNGASIGTIRFAAAGTVATFLSFSATSIAVNDVLEIVAPGTADATLADISFTLAGVL